MSTEEERALFRLQDAIHNLTVLARPHFSDETQMLALSEAEWAGRYVTDMIGAAEQRGWRPDREAMARAVHGALSRANVNAYLDMPSDVAEQVADAILALLPPPPTGVQP